MKRKDKYKLMGKIVSTNAKYNRVINEETREVTWQPTSIEARAGWVTGFKHLQEGVIHSGSTSYEGEFKPGYFDVKKTVPAVMVVFWFNMKPIPVPLSHITEGGEPKPTTCKWPESAKATLREEMKNWPREKGRFLKPFK